MNITRPVYKTARLAKFGKTGQGDKPVYLYKY